MPSDVGGGVSASFATSASVGRYVGTGGLVGDFVGGVVGAFVGLVGDVVGGVVGTFVGWSVVPGGFCARICAC